MTIEASIENILSSYRMYEGTNFAEKKTFPNRRIVLDVLQDLESLIFPGFRTALSITPQNIRYITGELVHRIVPLLTKEISKAFVHAGTSKDLVYDNDMEQAIASALIAEIPDLRRRLVLDAEAIFRGDPAAKNVEEVISSYPGLEAIMVHRIAHFLFKRNVPIIPRIMSEYVHSRTGIDIHPGATIGDSFFIDHGTGIVVGETTIIGRNVKLYQGVTLGSLSVEKSLEDVKRHPTIEDDVTIYAGATILGGSTVIGRGATIGGNTWVTRSIEPGTMVVQKR